MQSPSPFYSEEHEAFRATVRRFVAAEIEPYAAEWDEAETFPRELYQKAAAIGLLQIGFPAAYGGIAADVFYRIIAAQELARAGAGGISAGLNSHTIGAPPIAVAGAEALKARVLPGVLSGREISALAITEPDAGSDVAAIRTRAVRDGDEWVINGAKTYITNGHRSSMITLVCKTDPDAGYDGFSIFLVPMDAEGVIRESKLSKMGMHASDTALLAFQDVRVGPEALLGQEGKGFFQIMWELQAERLIGAAGCLAYGQYAFDKTLEYGLYPFVVGDIVKLYLAAVLLPGAWKLVGRFR